MTGLFDKEDHTNLVSLAVKIVSAYVSNNPLPTGELPKLIGDVHAVLQAIGKPAAGAVVALVPALPIKKSVTPDYIICLEDGKKFKWDCQEFCARGHDDGKERIITWLSRRNFWTNCFRAAIRVRCLPRTGCWTS